MMHFRLSPFFALLRFLGAKAVLASKCGRNRPKRIESALLRLFAKMASEIPKKALARATSLTHARFHRFGAKRAEKCVLGRKSAH